MTVLALTGAVVMAAVLLRAALGKLRAPRELAATITKLGLPERVAYPSALLVMLAEVAVAVLLLFRPGWPGTQLAVISLGALFALAGALALRTGERVACGCFGADDEGALGTRQLVWLVPWTAGAALQFFTRPVVPPVIGAALFAGTALAIAATLARPLRAAVRVGREDRKSAEEMYEWLPSY